MVFSKCPGEAEARVRLKEDFQSKSLLKSVCFPSGVDRKDVRDPEDRGGVTGRGAQQVPVGHEHWGVRCIVGARLFGVQSFE